MNGKEFYEFLRNTYNQNGQALYGDFTFREWLYKPRTNSYSFRFNIIRNNPKAIPRDVIIASWDANQHIDDNWLEVNFEMHFHNDCRLHILNFLIDKNKQLR